MSINGLLFVGYRYNKQGPYLVFDNFELKQRQALMIKNKTMTIELTDTRYCIGTYDLSTFVSSQCKYHSALDSNYKGNHCALCNKEIGFNPAFYNASTISPQQLQYNNQPHVVYMAYFSSSCVKVGIASKKRHITRLLEQGARAAMLIGEYPNAQMARDLEKQLCSYDTISEAVSSERKLKFLFEETYCFELAESVLTKYSEQFHSFFTSEDIIDLQNYYFFGEAFSRRIEPLCEQKNAQISGKIIGMIGDLAIIEQNNDLVYAVSVKKYISHLVNYYPNEVKFLYEVEPKQYTLWDY